MFGIFNKKSPIEKLEIKYKKLLQEAYTLSSTNRRLSDSKIAESNEVLKLIELVKKDN